MYCNACGTDNREGHQFCARCGQPLAAPQQQWSSYAAAPPPAYPYPPDEVNLFCVAGADQGRAFRINTSQCMLGRCAGLADPMVADQHVWVYCSQGGLQYRSSTPECYLEVNGYRMGEGRIEPGSQFRIGSSVWQVMSAAPPPGAYGPAGENPLDALKRKLNELAGTDKLEGFSLKEMFSEVFKRRTPEEMDDYFIVGTYRTTPPINQVPTGWPKPWLFFRVLVFLALTYVGLLFMAQTFMNPNAVPGMLIMGALAAPLATLILFFELNAPRNVPFHRVLGLTLMGGVVSLIISLFGFSGPGKALDWLGASSAGLIEETGKILTVALLMRNSRDKYVLNGILYGAAVGAGFGFFESAGYGFQAILRAMIGGLQNGANLSDALSQAFSAAAQITALRASIAPFMHVAWTAIAAAFLWRAKGAGPITIKTLISPVFLKGMPIPMILHMIWNSPFAGTVPLMLAYWSLGILGWFFLFGLVQSGLKQVRADQIYVTRTQIARTQAGARAS